MGREYRSDEGGDGPPLLDIRYVRRFSLDIPTLPRVSVTSQNVGRFCVVQLFAVLLSGNSATRETALTTPNVLAYLARMGLSIHSARRLGMRALRKAALYVLAAANAHTPRQRNRLLGRHQALQQLVELLRKTDNDVPRWLEGQATLAHSAPPEA